MPGPIKVLKIYTDESAYFGDHKVFEVVATRARAAQVSGATVVKALLGFGHTPHEHRRHVLNDDQSVVIEILDEESKLRAFVASLSDLEHLGPVTLQEIEVLHWPAARAPEAAEPHGEA